MSNTKFVLPIFVADAFSKKAFSGNGAAICPLNFHQVVPDDVKQKIAAEINLSETAFISLLDKNDTFETGNCFGLRWFTPKCEVDLCGHATLASASVLFSLYNNQSPVVEFKTASGILKAKRLPDGRIEMNLPAYEPKHVIVLLQLHETNDGLVACEVRCSITYSSRLVWWPLLSQYQDIKQYEAVIRAAVGSLPYEEVLLSSTKYMMIRLKDNVTRQQLQALKPSAAELLAGVSDMVGVIVTLKGSGMDDCTDDEGNLYDFISRFFAPWTGVLEDPVCGSAHSILAPFWSRILQKNKLYARMCSLRGGDLWINMMRSEDKNEDRVAISGHSAIVLRGQMSF